MGFDEAERAATGASTVGTCRREETSGAMLYIRLSKALGLGPEAGVDHCLVRTSLNSFGPGISSVSMVGSSKRGME